MRTFNRIVPLLLVFSFTAAGAQERRRLLSFEEAARFASAQEPIDAVRGDLTRYCFHRLDSHGEQIITRAVRTRRGSADPSIILDYIRQHPCPAMTPPLSSPSAPPVSTRRAPEPRRHQPPTPQSPANDTTTRGISLGTGTREERVTTTAAPRLVAADNTCAVNHPPANRRDLLIPRHVRYVYSFLQTPGPAEDAESERLAIAMPRDEFVKCFEAFRDLARARGRRLIITATDEGHRSWYQPDIRFRGQRLRPTEYKSPYEDRVYPGAEVPLN